MSRRAVALFLAGLMAARPMLASDEPAWKIVTLVSRGDLFAEDARLAVSRQTEQWFCRLP